jgi:hypothetical protein
LGNQACFWPRGYPLASLLRRNSDRGCAVPSKFESGTRRRLSSHPRYSSGPRTASRSITRSTRSPRSSTRAHSSA